MKTLLQVTLSDAAGVTLGFLVAYYVPFAVALARDDNPFHVGQYGLWFIILLVILPPGLGLLLGVLQARAQGLSVVRVARWVALVGLAASLLHEVV